MQKNTTYRIYSPEELDTINLDLKKWDRIFFYGDLGVWKTTFIRSILRKYLADPLLNVRSPTYTYFQKYGEHIYHFDLYRIEDEETFFLIGGQDIWDSPDTICLIEWPERVEQTHPATKTVTLQKLSDSSRDIIVEYKN